jgi:hypothetical protein
MGKKRRHHRAPQPASCIIGGGPGQCTVNASSTSTADASAMFSTVASVTPVAATATASTISINADGTLEGADNNFVTGYATMYNNNKDMLIALAGQFTDYTNINNDLTNINGEIIGELTTDMSKYNVLAQQYNTSLIAQETELQRQLDEGKNSNQINNRKSYYKNQHFSILSGWNIYASYAYVVLGIVVGIYLLLSEHGLTWKTKITGLIVITIMYFTMQYIISFLILLAYQIYTILPTNVYTTL